MVLDNRATSRPDTEYFQLSNEDYSEEGNDKTVDITSTTKFTEPNATDILNLENTASPISTSITGKRLWFSVISIRFI